MRNMTLDPTPGRTAAAAPDASPAPALRRRDARSWLRANLAVIGIGMLTAALYLWSLNHVGWANTYYAAAVKAGTKSWKAFFFGSIDPGSFITVDKPPAALWVMELSARLFGFSSWSMLAGVVAGLMVAPFVDNS